MNNTTLLKSLLLTAALTTAAAVRADEPTPVPASGTMGLLGQTYAGLTYSYVNLDSSPVNADSYNFEFNESLMTGVDGIFGYTFMQTGVVAGSRLKEQALRVAARAFSTQPWGKPYVEAGAGYAWTKFAGGHDNSVIWDVAAGAEFQVAPAVTITPYVQYRQEPDLAGGGKWNFGAKANYWVNSQWSITGGISRNDDQDTTFTLGTNFRY